MVSESKCEQCILKLITFNGCQPVIAICLQEKMARLAVLLSLQQPPTRQSLLRDAARFGVVQAAVPHVQHMYNFLEVEFHPLKLCSRMEASIKFVEEAEELSQVCKCNIC